MTQDPEATQAAANMQTAVAAQQAGRGVGIADTGGAQPSGFGAAPGIGEAMEAYEQGVIGLAPALGYSAMSAFSPPGMQFGTVTDEVSNQTPGANVNIGGMIGGIAGMASGVPGAGMVGGMIGSQVADALGVPTHTFSFADGGAATGGRMNPRMLPGIHLKTNHRFADGGTVGQQDEDVGFDAYHGSPHEFDQFDIGKIGTGEGAQAYGHGLYFAENEDVAKGYRDAYANRGIVINGKPFNSFLNPVTTAKEWDSLSTHLPEEIRKHVSEKINSGLGGNAILNDLTTDFFGEYHEPVKKIIQGPGEGHMYHVRVKANPEHFLDWDAPLSEQHPNIQEFARNADISHLKPGNRSRVLMERFRNNQEDPNYLLTGANLVTALNKTDKHTPETSAQLRDAGIPGIKYFDAGSRGKGDGTRNYVVFDHNLIETKRRYADGGEITPPRDLGADPTVQRALDITRQPTKPLFTQDVYHGTAGDFPEFRDQAGDYSMSRGLGIHVARDPIISSNPYFVNRNNTGEGGNVLPLKTFSDERFYEINQPLHGYLPEGTPKAPNTVRTDDTAVENEIMAHAFKRDKALLKRALMEQRQLSEDEANEAVDKLHSGQPWEHHDHEVKNIDHLVKNYGLKPYNEEDRAWAVKSFRDALIKRGYVGVKYINTSPGETENAKDPTCYIIFPKKGGEGVYPLRGRFAKYDPARAHEGDIMSARGGRIGYADGGMPDDDPTVQRALDITRQAQPEQSLIPGAMQVAQTVAAPGRRRFEIAPARVAPMTIDQKDRDLPEEGSVTIKRLTDAFKKAIDNHLSLPPAQQIANARQAENNVAQYVGRGKTGKINSVLTANKKLMKAQTAGEDDTPLMLPDGRTLEMTGLALMPDYREGQFKMCGNSDVCRDLCLGKESGQYRYDPTATQAQMPMTKEELAAAGGKPRMAAFRRTQAMMRDPESFAVYLHELIDGAKIMAEKRGAHLGVRLNVLSDLSPKIMEPIIKAHPEVSFYDYTKMNYDQIAPNHHYTYSSTGLSQPDRGVENPYSNWRKMRDRLDQGHNVAMAFAHGKSDAFPEHLHDEETGKKYRVVSGDEHDFRPMDMVPEGEDGVIIALKNMAASNSEYKYENAAKNSHGFFVHHEPDFLKNNRGTFARDENGNRISRNKVYTVPVQPMKRGAVRQQEN
jgi:hypothetical protein